MKRWGFHGMPDMHGVTKSHRRIGCIGSGRAKVWAIGACIAIGSMILISFSPEYGLVRRCLEMLEANTNGLVDCEFGGLTMTSLSSTSRALGYLARLETHCKCVTQGYLDTGEKSTSGGCSPGPLIFLPRLPWEEAHSCLRRHISELWPIHWTDRGDRCAPLTLFVCLSAEICKKRK